MADDEDLITVALIARPQGLRGEVIADLRTDFPDRFEELAEIRLRLASGQVVERQLEYGRLHKARIVLKLVGIDSVEQAEMLRGASVVITRSQLVPLPPDSYYDFDLVGCQVLTSEGTPVGEVAGVEHYGAAPLLVVVSPETREFLIPLAARICVEVDTGRKRIVVDPPAGLLD
ncbi:MAG: ribosome maturation factor RimM [Acidobacteriota bacterium]